LLRRGGAEEAEEKSEQTAMHGVTKEGVSQLKKQFAKRDAAEEAEAATRAHATTASLGHRMTSHRRQASVRGPPTEREHKGAVAASAVGGSQYQASEFGRVSEDVELERQRELLTQGLLRNVRETARDREYAAQAAMRGPAKTMYTVDGLVEDKGGEEDQADGQDSPSWKHEVDLDADIPHLGTGNGKGEPLVDEEGDTGASYRPSQSSETKPNDNGMDERIGRLKRAHRLLQRQRERELEIDMQERQQLDGSSS
jgi:hypothetical protein